MGARNRIISGVVVAAATVAVAVGGAGTATAAPDCNKIVGRWSDGTTVTVRFGSSGLGYYKASPQQWAEAKNRIGRCADQLLEGASPA